MSKSFEQYIRSQTLNLDSEVNGDSRESLSTLCTDIFLIVIKLGAADDAGSYESILKLIRYYIKQFDRNCRSFTIDPEVHHLVKYALVALVDEVIISSSFDFVEEWVSNPLQTVYFNEMMAGEKFYKNLEKLLAAPKRNYEIIEIYYFCLCLGFRGKYNNDPPKRDKIIRGVARILVKNKPAPDYEEETTEKKQERSFSLPYISPWLVGSISFALIVIMWIITVITNMLHSQQLFPG